MSGLGHSQQMQRALKYIDVPFDPKATVSDQSVIRRDGPFSDSCTAANNAFIRSLVGAAAPTTFV